MIVRRPGLQRLSTDRVLLAERAAERIEGAPAEPGEPPVTSQLETIVHLDRRIAEIAHEAGGPHDNQTLRALVVAFSCLPPGSAEAAAILARAITQELQRTARARREGGSP